MNGSIHYSPATVITLCVFIAGGVLFCLSCTQSNDPANNSSSTLLTTLSDPDWIDHALARPTEMVNRTDEPNKRTQHYRVMKKIKIDGTASINDDLLGPLMRSIGNALSSSGIETTNSSHSMPGTGRNAVHHGVWYRNDTRQGYLRVDVTREDDEAFIVLDIFETAN